LLAGGFQVLVDRLPSLLCQFELDWLASFPLPHCGALERIAVRCDILDPEGDDIAAT
jgi:hypothetical protein